MSNCCCMTAMLDKAATTRARITSGRAHSRADVKRFCGSKLVKRRVFCRGKAEPESEDVGGNKEVQEALLESLRLGIKRQQTKEEVEESFQQEVQKLREIAEQAKDDLEQVANLNKMRQDLAFGSTLADLLSDVDQMQEELRKSREQTEADQREFEQWERDTNIARSQGLFFQSLYPVKPPKPGATTGDAGSSTASTSSGGDADELSAALRSQAAAGTRQAIQEVTKDAVVAPWRLYLLTYMILILLLFATYDVLGPTPSPLQDGALVFLAGLMGLAAWNERQAVVLLTQDQNQQAAAGRQQSTTTEATAPTESTGEGKSS